MTAPAQAGDATWSATVEPAEPTAADRHPAPRVLVRVIGDREPEPADLTDYLLRQADGALPGVAPVRVIPYRQSRETIALALLIEGHEYYFGNDHYRAAATSSASSTPPAGSDRPENVPVVAGVYEPLRAALDGAGPDRAAALATAGPPGSKGALLVYGTGVDLRQPMADLARLTGDKLGAQELQRGNVTRDLLIGLGRARAELRGVDATRKVLIVIGDGIDPAASPADFADLRRLLDRDGIEVFALSLASPSAFLQLERADRERGLANLRGLGRVKVVADGRALGRALAALVTDELATRYGLEFPGQVVDRGGHVRGLVWDGAGHELILTRADDELGRQTVALSRWQPSRPRQSRSWPWFAGGAAALAGLAVLVAGMRKSRPVAVPVPWAAGPPPMPGSVIAEPIRSRAARVATVAVDFSFGDGIPVVGWLVPLDGPQRGQTFKMAPGTTRIGNRADADVVLADERMSGYHAEMIMAQDGFTVVDRESTNGTFVNDRRVTRHHLVDNERIRFGGTTCKFKTIVGS